MLRKTLTVSAVALVLTGLIVPTATATVEEEDRASPDVQDKRGCCSHHGGVCGCADHATMCCDHSASPTCGC